MRPRRRTPGTTRSTRDAHDRSGARAQPMDPVWPPRRDQPSQGRAAHAGPQPGRVVMARPGRGLPARYVFRIEGHLDGHWSAWFDDLEVEQQDDATTTLAG